MSGKSYLIILALMALLSSGCTRQLYHDGGSPLDKNWGRPYEEQKYSQIIDHEAGKNGPDQPPKNSVAAIADTVKRFRNSARKNMANFIPEYSILYPAISSCSA